MATYHLTDRDDDATISIEAIGDACLTLSRAGVSEIVAYKRLGPRISFVSNGVSHVAHIHQDADKVWVHLDGRVDVVSLLDEKALRRRERSGSVGDDGPVVTSPMAGRVVAIRVAAGAEVAIGDSLTILEAMKMENDIKSTRAGVIESIHVAEGDAVEVGTPLMTFADEA